MLGVWLFGPHDSAENWPTADSADNLRASRLPLLPLGHFGLRQNVRRSKTAQLGFPEASSWLVELLAPLEGYGGIGAEVAALEPSTGDIRSPLYRRAMVTGTVTLGLVGAIASVVAAVAALITIVYARVTVR
jgi:hypothetical protein